MNPVLEHGDMTVVVNDSKPNWTRYLVTSDTDRATYTRIALGAPYVASEATERSGYHSGLWTHESTGGTAFPNDLALGLLAEDSPQASTEIGLPSRRQRRLESAIVLKRLHQALLASSEIVFEDGMTTPFSRAVAHSVNVYRLAAVEAIRTGLAQSILRGEAASDALTWAARSAPPSIADEIRALLEEAIEDPSFIVRDGALLGIASMDDPRSIPAVRQAIAQEPIEELAREMEDVLAQLEETRECHTS